MVPSSLSTLALAASPASLGSLRWIDLLGLGIVVLFLALGALRGLWWQIVRLLGIVAAVSVARAVTPRFSPALETTLPGLGPRTANGLSWLLILLAGLIAVALIGRLGRATIEAAQLGAVDRIGGALVGAAAGTLVHIALLLCLCQLSPKAWATSTVSGTHSQDLLDTIGRSFPVLIDAQAAESLAPLHGDPSSVR
jgi:uncharacterized membrane protein required for colicin V production